MNEYLDRVRNLYIGRINQKQFIILAIIMLVVEIIATSIGSQTSITFGGIGTVVNVLILLSLAIITMHLYVRRLHDVDVSGWAALIIILLIVIHIVFGLILFLILAIVPSVPYTNQYGGLPKKDRSLFETFMNT